MVYGSPIIEKQSNVSKEMKEYMAGDQRSDLEEQFLWTNRSTINRGNENSSVATASHLCDLRYGW